MVGTILNFCVKVVAERAKGFSFFFFFFDDMPQMRKYHYGRHLRLVRMCICRSDKLFLLQSELSTCLR